MAIAAALFSRFYQGGLAFIKRTRVGTGDGLGTVRVFPMALVFGEMRGNEPEGDHSPTVTL